YFEQALQALAHLPEPGDTQGLAIGLRFDLALTLASLGEYGRCLALLREAEALARSLDDRAQLGRVLGTMINGLRLTVDYGAAITAGRQAFDLAAELGNSALQTRASYYLGRAYAELGDFGRAAELQRWCVEVADREASTWRTGLRIAARAFLAWTLSELGAFAEGRRH